MSQKTISTIGLAKETESPENPGGLEKRVAMIPKDVKSLIDFGVEVFAEEGAGEDIGFTDDQYVKAGAKLQKADELYRNKDMVLKFKGPSLENASKMDANSVLFCMAHFKSFPKRAELLEDKRINVVAMEEVVQTPKLVSDDIIIGKCFVGNILRSMEDNLDNLHIGFIAYGEQMVGGIRRAGNRHPDTISLFQADVQIEELKHFGENSLYFYDSRNLINKSIIEQLVEKSCKVYDLKEFVDSDSATTVQKYRDSHPPFEFGGRKIQCLHETGMAGARYGFTLHDKAGRSDGSKIKASILGYGNVGMGAIHECYNQGVREIQILGKKQTATERIGEFISNSNLIINGAEQPAALRGKNYLIKREYIGNIIKKDSVVIDLVGGSATNRSPVEDIIECSYLTNPHFERDGVMFSALWGWPMMGMMKESAIKYSGQILDILIGDEKLIDGIDDLAPGVKPALVCGPFK